MGGEAKLVGGEHEGFFPHRFDVFDAVVGDVLLLSAGGDDDGGVGTAEEDTLDFVAILEGDFLALVAVGDARGRMDECFEKGFLALVGDPVFEVGSELDSLVIDLVAGEAAGDVGFASDGITLELEKLLWRGQLGFGGIRNGVWADLDGVGIVETAFFEEFSGAEFLPVVEPSSNEPPGRFFGKVVGFGGDFSDCIDGLLGSNEGENFQSELTFPNRELVCASDVGEERDGCFGL